MGDDPRNASITFHSRQDSDGSPASFFPEHGERWYWPGHGIRLDNGPLIIFLYAMVATPGQGLGFATAGYAVAVIENPDASVESWNPRVVNAALSTFDAVPATALVQDGAYIVVLSPSANKGRTPVRLFAIQWPPWCKATSRRLNGGPGTFEAGWQHP